jgi:hypothetical protein
MTYNPITELFSNFFNRKITLSDVEPAAGEDHIIATTFRIPADIKNYYEKMAASSRMTLQGAIIQVLGNLMDRHINNQATMAIRSLADRFFRIFSMHGIAIYNIPRILKDFNVTIESIANEEKVVEMVSDSMIKFLAETFNLRKTWIQTGTGLSHITFYCYKDIHQWFALMQQKRCPITLKLFFDQSILLNPAIGANGNCRLQDARYVKCVLFVEEELNGIKYTNPYDLGDLDWDYHKTNNHIYGLIEGMNITREYGERRIQKFAGNLYEAEQENLVLHMVNDFKNYDTTLNRVYSGSRDFGGVDEILEEVKQKEQKVFQEFGNNTKDYHSIEKYVEQLRKREYTFPPKFTAQYS